MSTELEVLGVQIREKNGALQISLRRTVHQAIELGGLIAEAKALLAHGAFTPWIEKHGLVYDTAHRYMDLFEYKTKTCRVQDLTTAYALIEELKAQTKEIKKAVDQKVITPAQALELDPGPDYVDEFTRKREEIKADRKEEREAARRERKQQVPGPTYDNYDTVARIVKRLASDLDQLPDNTRRIELCHDLIKYLKAKTNEYQRASAR